MKKILSLTLAALMLVSMIPTAMATTTDWESGTTITLNGSGAEAYTVTVPAAMSPGDTATVKAEGTWGADKLLAVTAPKTVTLTYGAQNMDVDITFGSNYSTDSIGFVLLGSSVEEVTASHDITVAEASTLFGTWTGTIVYTVDLIEKGDVNRDGVIDAADIQILKDYSMDQIELTDGIANYGDITGDGEVKTNDYKKLKNILIQNGIEVTIE